MELSTKSEVESFLCDVVFSPAGSMLATSVLRNDDVAHHRAPLHVMLWDTRSGELLRVLEGGDIADFYREDVTSLSFSPDGEPLAATLQSGLVVVWNTNSGDRLYDLFMLEPSLGIGALDSVWSVQWSPDSHYVLTASTERAALWDSRSGCLLWILGPS